MHKQAAFRSFSNISLIKPNIMLFPLLSCYWTRLLLFRSLHLCPTLCSYDSKPLFSSLCPIKVPQRCLPTLVDSLTTLPMTGPACLSLATFRQRLHWNFPFPARPPSSHKGATPWGALDSACLSFLPHPRHRVPCGVSRASPASPQPLPGPVPYF